MPFELQAIVGTVLILFVLLMFQGGLVPVNQGFAWGLGGRDAKRDYSALQLRIARTIANHIEGMVMFVPLILVLQAMNISSDLTICGAGLYLAGRLVFALCYLLAIPYLRSFAWAVSIIGIILIAIETIKSML